MKPSIRKQDGRWLVTRPGYGFNPTPAVERFGSWKAAVASLRSAPGSAGASVDRGAHTLHSVNQRGWPQRGTIRMGPESGRKCGCGNWQPCLNPACVPPKVPAPPPPPPPTRSGTIRMEDR